ncbi:MAG TPA: M20/M25/M40 family metallo-hydrolase [Kofleriaceae bacterium]|nr:M20/M25/M40 family metallo-hydrolase [Kofleriaceae bacterium]
MRSTGLALCVLIAACGPHGRTGEPVTGKSPVTAPKPEPEPVAGVLSAEERAIAGAVDRDNDAAIALLEKVVNINSGTLNPTGVRAVGAVFDKELKALGFETRWVEGAAFQRAGHLVAERAGSGPKVLLIGHLDTVFEPDSPFQRFERLGPDSARGPGVIDMKGGDVIIVFALKALATAGLLDGMHLVVVMTGDEEAPGNPRETSRAALLEAARGCAAAIGFEDGDGSPERLVIARRSGGPWKLEVKGNTAHSSQIFRPDIGYGAAFEVARILDGFRTRLAGQEYLTFNPGLVLAGTPVEHDRAKARGSAAGKPNVIAEQAVVVGDLRALTREQRENAMKVMSEVVAASLPGTSATITFDDGGPPLAPTEGNRRLLAMVDQISLDLGAGRVTAVDPMRAGGADVSYLDGRVPMIIDALGLKGDGGHTANETADLRTLSLQTKRAAILLHRLAR